MSTQGDHDAALPPPPPIPAGVVPRRCPMTRNGFGLKGQKVQLLTNHFQVRMAHSDGHFYQYSVCIFFFAYLSDFVLNGI